MHQYLIDKFRTKVFKALSGNKKTGPEERRCEVYPTRHTHFQKASASLAFVSKKLQEQRKDFVKLKLINKVTILLIEARQDFVKLFL